MSHLKNCSIHCVEAESEHPVAGDGTEVMEIVAVTRRHEGAPPKQPRFTKAVMPRRSLQRYVCNEGPGRVHAPGRPGCWDPRALPSLPGSCPAYAPSQGRSCARGAHQGSGARCPGRPTPSWGAFPVSEFSGGEKAHNPPQNLETHRKEPQF